MTTYREATSQVKRRVPMLALVYGAIRCLIFLLGIGQVRGEVIL